MKQWWERNKAVLGDYTKDEVEDFTGCIPLLLDMCVVDGKINLEVEAFHEICNQAAAFMRSIKKHHDRSDWNLYVELAKPPGHS